MINLLVRAVAFVGRLAQGIDDRRSFDWESWFLAIFGDRDLIGITIVGDRDLSDFFFQNVPLDLDHTK